MSGSHRKTQEIQQWMQAVITHHGGVERGVQSEEARGILDIDAADVESVILPSRRMSSLERLEVYGNAYYARLIHCLQEYFPALRYAVGEEGFDQFAFGYLQRFPPGSYTLGKLADHFVQFLEESRDEHFSAEGEVLAAAEGSDEDFAPPAWSRFIVELARLEYAIDVVFDGPGVEDDPPELNGVLASISPEAWETLRLTPAPCLKLLAFEFPVNGYYTAFRREESPSIPQAEPTWLAITRREYIVRRYPLSETQHALLAAIVSGATLGEAVEVAADTTSDVEQLVGSLAEWFSLWARAQFFVGVETEGL